MVREATLMERFGPDVVIDAQVLEDMIEHFADAAKKYAETGKWFAKYVSVPREEVERRYGISLKDCK